jgi:septum formation protein
VDPRPLRWPSWQRGAFGAKFARRRDRFLSANGHRGAQYQRLRCGERWPSAAWSSGARRAKVSAVSTLKISSKHPLCLGSASPRRRELLSGLALPLRVVVGDVDEDARLLESPLDYLDRVVRDKLHAIARRPDQIQGCAALVVADTIVRIEDRIIGKPRDIDDALALLRTLSGREHLVHTRYAIASVEDFARPLAQQTITSRVFLRSAPLAILRRYAETREGLDKAGAYAVQGIGAFLVERIEGSYTNVVGLPICEVIDDLLRAELLENFP